MKKKKSNIGKEVFILIVLSILIMLILAVALYDFIPANINMPEPISYSSDSKTTSIKQEIAYTNGGDLTADESSTEDLVTSLKSYSIQASDLTVYGQKNLYNSGNSNPFDYAPEETTPTDGTTAEGTATDPTTGEPVTGTSTNATTQNSTTGTFFESSTSK